LHEYTKGLSYKQSKVSDLIYNLKRHPSYKTRPEVWKYKLRAIDLVGRALAQNLNPKWLRIATLVPIPPSKTKEHPEFDDRMMQILLSIQKHSGISCDIRELIIQTVDKDPAHSKDEHRDIDKLKEDYKIDHSLIDPPATIGLFDDMLTTGAHFCACRDILVEKFHEVSIVGIFIARRMIPEQEIDLEPVE